MKFDNATKETWRGWAWNQLEKRLPPGSLVVVLAGECAGDAPHAEKRGLRVVGVDTNMDCVRAFRKAGGVAIQGDVSKVVALLKPDALIADMLGGMTCHSMQPFYYARDSRAIVWNGLRGRDTHGGRVAAKYSLEMVPEARNGRCRKTQIGLHRGKLMFLQLLKWEWETYLVERRPGDLATIRHIRNNVPEWFLDIQTRRMMPEYSSYRSPDGSGITYFDSIAVTLHVPEEGLIVRGGPFDGFRYTAQSSRAEYRNPPKTLVRRVAAAKAILKKKGQKF